MRNKLFKKIIILLVLLICISMINMSIAHSGRTDSNGGHYDSSTGEYHYHHGYSEHQHFSGFCPYEAELSKLLPSTCPNCSSIVNAKNGYYCFECAYELVPLSNLNILSPVNGDADKTRNEYFKEVQSLQAKIEEKDNIINNLYKIQDKADEEIEELKNNNKKQINNIIFCFIFIFFITIYISYNIGQHKNNKKTN